MSDTSSNLAGLTERIAKLEKQNRIWRMFVIIALLIVIAIPLIWFAKEQGNLESQSFVLLDAAGKHRAVLGTSADGSPSLVFYDKDGHILTLLNTKSDGSPSLQLYNKDGSPVFRVP
jgi:hypothetical protein